MLLKENFPNVPQLPLPGYHITYSRSGGTFVAKILVQIPKILGAIRRERQWLREMQTTHQFHLVISDNRYGLKIDGLKSVIMTHQLQIMTGFGTSADSLMRRLHYRMLEKFDQCWVVDEHANGGLAGALSHPRELPGHARYVGLLSQLRPPKTSIPPLHDGILVLLSGPEPMRGILEEKLLQQASTVPEYHFHIIAGNPAGDVRTHLPAHITYVTHANASELARALARAQLVICRSGYSTLMDLAVLKKKALLVPTPGQSEQEYLARYSETQGIALCRQQAELDLRKDIGEALHYSGFTRGDYEPLQMQNVIDDSLKSLKN
ncbi:Glycosyl transferase family 1 [Dyadobacter sp. SG02]|uniref:glycosyltransferase n=1 Tax=Dyadobacter sp. SG02 TaxID=1855291 RepID=UPI0008B86E37|nr:glycosyltransferase [Dyadobacter sp. SG02]SEJ50104.1 Glycosyl transferase family 1 [Dyadobacter sp. SG02]